MLDIKFIRENLEVVKAGAKKKKVVVNVDRLVGLDDQRRTLLKKVEGQRALQNEVSKKIAAASDSMMRDVHIRDMQGLKANMQQDEEELKTVIAEWRVLMLKVPNVPDMTVPDGDSDADNQEIRVWGEKPQFPFAPKDHTKIMRALDMVDLDRGAKVSGFRGYFLKNDGVRLSFAIWQYALDFFGKRGFTLMMAPSVVNKEPFVGTGFLPQSEEDLYKTQDGAYLSGTAEVPTMGYHMDEVLDKKDLPKRYLVFSTCYRREAGAHGKDVKGLIRVHEFYKIEQVILAEASHQVSVEMHEWLNCNTEEFIQSLGIPYHVVVNCGGDLGLGQVKKYDIELWVPGEMTYREISSASYFHDFQTRRLNIRYRDDEGKLQYAHSLNSTAIPTPRILVSLVENFQQEDGSIVIPEVLRPYMGKDSISK